MRYRAMPGVIFVSVCESMFLVKADEIIRINEMTALCWEKLKKGTDVDELVTMATENYEVADIKSLREDIMNLLESLVSRELVVRFDL